MAVGAAGFAGKSPDFSINPQGYNSLSYPLAKPTYNGGVERENRTLKEEFYDKSDLTTDSIQAMRYEPQKAVHKYNTYCPHYVLDELNTMQYILY